MRIRRAMLVVIPFLLLGWGPVAAAQDPTTTTVTVTTSDGNPIPAGTEIQVVKVDPEPSTMLHDETLATDQASGYQIPDLPTDPNALYSVNVFPSSGYSVVATGTYHGGVNIDVQLEALPPTPTTEPTATATETPVPTETATPMPTETEVPLPTATDTPEATATATMSDETPVSTATEASTLAPTEPAANPTATVQVASLPSTGQGDSGSGMGMGIIGLLGLATVFAGLAGWRIRRR